MKTDWSSRWQKNQTGWDLHGPHPNLEDLLHKIKPILSGSKNISSIQCDRLPRSLKAFVPGCGRAHDAAALARAGFYVKAADIVPIAIESAIEQYGNLEHLTLEVKDCLFCEACDRSQFDLIFDRAMLCAVDGEERERYISACYDALKPNGLFASIVFTRVAKPELGPPFEMSLLDLNHAFAEKWDQLIFDPILNERTIPAIISEALFVVQKKAALA